MLLSNSAPSTFLQSSRHQTNKKQTSAVKSSRTKKTVQALSTNPSSYDRTDPFFAFNTLIKLLGSLPSRVGGCQYKLTPEEHKLSLYLLGIVEPFVGLAPSRRTITRQPTEILDAIIFHIDSRTDLLSLALSCHRMHDVVCPRHIDYRVVRCKVSAIRVWNHLIVNRALARNVRRLEILDERCTAAEQEIVPPGILASDTDLETTDDELCLHDKQERFLVSALAKMTALSSFSWSCNHSPISIDNVWPALLRCHSLQEVDISDNLAFSAPSGNLDRKQGRQTVSLNITYNSPRSTPNVAAPRPQADDLLLFGRWTHLTSLTLVNVRCSPTTGFDSTSSFISAHPNLEVLHLDIGPIPTSSGDARLVLYPNSLPRLRELQSNKEIATAILSCPAEQPRPLETIKGFRLSGAHGGRDMDLPFLANLKLNGTSVRRIELEGWNEMDDLRRLIECAPGITWLDVGRKGSAQGLRERDGSSKAFSATTSTNTLEWATLLSELPELTTFHGVRFFFEVSNAAALPGVATTNPHISMTDRSRIRKNDEVAALLAWKCAKLRRLDHWEEGVGKVIVLVKDQEKEKVKWEVRRIKI
ncbi:hypothetical protein H0H92_011566 [Tricholoma furcatifolium]|nr:hypothetical protein H0H92_011566 [Tricholoma furcatifolium]